MSRDGRRRIRRIHVLLEDAYGPRPWQQWGPGIDGLVETILSQNTNDRNSGAAFESLKAAFPDWDAVRQASARRIARAIRVAGLSAIKSVRIKAILEAIHAERGDLSLEFLRHLSPTAARAWLERFHGVGRKTAACVLMFYFGMPVFPVDTHIHRIGTRLGLLGPTVGADAAHDVFQRIVPADLVYPVHVLLIEHGRRRCHARNPNCPPCNLQRQCLFVKQKAQSRTSRRAPRTGP